MENITNLIYIAISTLISILTLIILCKKKKEAEKTETKEDDEEVDELIKQNILLAFQQVKETCKGLNLVVKTKQLAKVAKKTAKEYEHETKNEK